ncbi:zinc finger, CCHC-type containing protein [Tanacetum coccineum]
MRTLGDSVDESYVVKKLLRAVSTKFLQIASTLEQFGDLDNMTVEEVIGKMKRDTRDRQRENTNLNRIEEGLEAPEDKAEEEVEVMVVGGTEYGQYAAELTIPKMRTEVIENNLIRDKLKTGNGVVDQSKLWYLDTGASNHMTGDKEKFRDLNETVQGYVKFGNETRVRIEGKGTIVFQCKNGEHRKLQEVYYIPDLCSNIISLGQLSECGDEIKIKEPFLWVRDKTGRLLMKVQRSPNRLYKIELEEVRSTCLIAQISDPTWLWHARLGHLNFGALKTMSDKNMVEGMPKLYVPTQPCEGCLVGKQTRHSFPAHTNYRATKRLELIHGDLCGPISPPTPSGNRYFMLLVDDYSRVMWVYLLKSKDEAFQVFKNFRGLVEVETGEKMKLFRTDRGGGVFCQKPITSYCNEQGWRGPPLQFTILSTAKQCSGEADRTVVEMVSKAFDMGLCVCTDVLWGEAVNHAVLSLNRVTF